MPADLDHHPGQQSRPDAPAGPPPGGVRSPTSSARSSGHLRRARPTTLGLVCVGVLMVLAHAWAARGVFLFWDDYKFLGQAEDLPLDRSYLGLELFSHFSPLTRLQMDLVLLDVGWARWYLLLLAALVVASYGVLMTTLHGRSRRAVLGWVVAGSSLSLVPATNWLTGGLNILPALALCALAFAAAVAHVRGGRARWAALSVLAYLVAVLGYEIAILLPAYVGLWVLAFGGRVTSDAPRERVLRHWPLWAGYVVVGLASLLNYRLGYYAPAPSGTAGEVAQGLVVSLRDAVLPSLLAVHAPGRWPGTLAAVLAGAVLLALVVWTVRRSRATAWGWLFAVLGWLVPTTSLVLNRVGIYGPDVASNLVYYSFAILFVVVGVLEAVTTALRAPAGDPAPEQWSRRRATPTGRRLPLAAGAWAALVAVGVAWVASAGGTLTQRAVAVPSEHYVDHVRESRDRLASEEPYTVLDTPVPLTLVPPEFAPYNRLSRVLDVNGIPLDLDDPGRPLYVVDESGTLVASDYRSLATVTTGPGRSGGRIGIKEADDVTRGETTCLTATSRTRVTMALGAPVTAPALTIRVLAEVDQPSTIGFRVYDEDLDEWIAPAGTPSLREGRAGTYLATSVGSASQVALRDLTPGTRLCLQSISLGLVESAGPTT